MKKSCIYLQICIGGINEVRGAKIKNCPQAPQYSVFKLYVGHDLNRPVFLVLLLAL